MVREAGLEPARPEWTLEPESSESANSTTRALLAYISTRSLVCQFYFYFFLYIPFCTNHTPHASISSYSIPCDIGMINQSAEHHKQLC